MVYLSSSGVNEYSEVPEKSDEKIPMTDCAAYAANPSSEKPSVSKETTNEADYENPDVVL